MRSKQKHLVKEVLGRVPLVPEMEWFLRRKNKQVGGFRLREVNEVLPEWVAQASASPFRDRKGKKVLLFGMLRYWTRHATLLSVAMAGLGHEVTFAYLPYANWRKKLSRYDLRLQNLFAKRILKQAQPLVKVEFLPDALLHSQNPHL